jgi:hypothetical protein
LLSESGQEIFAEKTLEKAVFVVQVGFLLDDLKSK